MKISLNWLRGFIDLPDSAETIADKLTLSGLEVEGIEHYDQVTGGLAGLVIGEVRSVRPHPNADRLQLTTVDVGENESLPIVCGASNVATGQRVVVATVGTTLYPTKGEPFIIKKAKIRGEESRGMICAEDEIGLGTSHNGIMVLTTDVPNGTPAANHFRPVSDTVLEIGLTPNRADAASHLGVARDLKALYQKPLVLPSVDKFNVDNQNLPIRVTVKNPEACPRYSGVTLSGVQVQESPDWVQLRLKAIGLSPINNIVDATNYVMHELGQPLHAFDADAIVGDEVIVRTLPAGSEFTTLDGKKRKLQASDLMICNAEGGMCIAGVFGGIESGVKNGTKNIFLESAYFSPEYVRRTAQHHSLKTDASFRYERGTDPNITVFALKRAILLIQEVAGGRVSSEIVDKYSAPIAPFRVAVQYAHVDRLIGKVIDRPEIKTILTELDIMVTEENDEGIVVEVPPYRVDVQREADVIEEVLRIHGYDQVSTAAHLKADYLASFPELDAATLRANISEMLVGSSFYEIVTNSLTKSAYAQALQQADSSVTVVNSLSEDLSVMRPSLLFSGLEVIAHNVNRQQKNLKLFEFGNTYQKHEDKYVETNELAIFMTGRMQSESWMTTDEPVSFHHLSSLIRKIFNRFDIDAPGQNMAKLSASDYGLQYVFRNKVLATVGQLNDSVTSLAGVQQPVFYANVYWPNLVANVRSASQKGRLVYQPISKFPEVRRDLSLVLDEQVLFSRVEEIVKQASNQLVRQVNVFDIYQGEQLAKGKKAYALSFTLQDQEKTLTDTLIEKNHEQAYEHLKT